MKEPYWKGVAIHPDPESCAGGGNIAGEALTGAHTGQPLSSEISCSACRPRRIVRLLPLSQRADSASNFQGRCAKMWEWFSRAHEFSKRDELVMTLEQLEERVIDLERQLAELRGEPNPSGSRSCPETTFGMFGDDPELDEIARLGKEYRCQVNTEDE